MILVIGATGYVGRYFCTEMVSKGVDVLALGRSKKVQEFFAENNVPFQYFDLNDELIGFAITNLLSYEKELINRLKCVLV